MDARARFSSRKFWLAEQALLLSFGLAVAGKLTAEFAAIVSTVVGAYIGVNGFVEGRRIAARNGHADA